MAHFGHPWHCHRPLRRVTAMARPRTIYRCSECGAAEPKWTGPLRRLRGLEHPRRGGAGAAALPAEADRPGGRGARCRSPRSTPRRGRRRPPTSASSTGCSQGGLVPGSVTVLGGEPGIGKSTLLLQALAGLAKAGPAVPLRHRRGVGPAGAAAGRAARRPRRPTCGSCPRPRCRTCSPTSTSVAPDVVAIDSIQTVFEPVAVLGARARWRRCASARTASCAVAKERAMSSVLVGHVTKDGALAGPAVLEHLVDTVLSFEGERHHALRLLRAVKHRFGSTDELGLFEMTDGGLEGVPDPSALFLADRRPGIPGSVVAPVLDGHRPAARRGAGARRPLRDPHAAPLGAGPRQRAAGAGARGARSSACRCPFAELRRPHASVAGGVRTVEPGADLALALALASARYGLAAARRPGRVRRGRPRRRAAPGAPDGPAPGRGRPARVPAGGGAGQRAAAPPGHRGDPRGHASSEAVDACTDELGAAARPDARSPGPIAATPGNIGRWPPAAAPSSSPRWRWWRPARQLREGLDRILQAKMGGAGRRGRRPRGAQHLLGRVPARRRLQPAAAVRAGQDGRRHHPGPRRQPHRPGQRAPRARTRTSPPPRPAPGTAPPSGWPARSTCR